MKSIYTPTQSVGDWQELLAAPKTQWRSGFSARSLAYAWEEADGLAQSPKEKLYARKWPSETKKEYAMPLKINPGSDIALVTEDSRQTHSCRNDSLCNRRPRAGETGPDTEHHGRNGFGSIPHT